MNFFIVLLACVLAGEAKEFGKFGGAAPPVSSQDEFTTVRPTRLPIPPSFSTAKPVVKPEVKPEFKPVVRPIVRPVVEPVVKPVVVPAVPVTIAVYPSQVSSVPRVPSNDGFAKTVKYENEIINNDGRNYFFETTNGIIAQEKLINYGNPPKTSISGEGYFSWTSPEGKFIEVHYTADENGYLPTSDAIPVIPAQFARALEYAAKYTAGIKK